MLNNAPGRTRTWFARAPTTAVSPDISAPRPALFMLTRETKTRSAPFASTSEERNDRRHLLQQTQSVDPAPVILARGPGKLHDPTELIAYSVGGKPGSGRPPSGPRPEEFRRDRADCHERQTRLRWRNQASAAPPPRQTASRILDKQGAARTGHGKRHPSWKKFRRNMRRAGLI